MRETMSLIFLWYNRLFSKHVLFKRCHKILQNRLVVSLWIFFLQKVLMIWSRCWLFDKELIYVSQDQIKKRCVIASIVLVVYQTREWGHFHACVPVWYIERTNDFFTFLLVIRNTFWSHGFSLWRLPLIHSFPSNCYA